MTFSQLAFKNVSQNVRAYGAYYLSSTFSVTVFFLYALFIYHPHITNGEGVPGAVRQGMITAEFIIYFFSFFFIFYAVSSFLKMRNKEFGIFVMHGMTKLQLVRMIFIENMLVGISALATGIGVGLLFGKLFFMLASAVMQIHNLPFYIPWQAMKITTIVFFILFFVVSFITSLFVQSRKVIALLKGNRKAKKEPKSSIILSLLAALLLTTGYTLSITAHAGSVMFLLFPVSIIVIIGTYFLYTQLSVFILRVLKKRKYIYWKKTNLLSFSLLAYRVRDNARMFFMVTIVSTVAFCAIGTFAAFLNVQKSETIKNVPFAFNFITYNEHQGQKEQYEREIETTFKKEDVTYEKVEAKVKFQSAVKENNLVTILNESDYNTFAKKLGYETVVLKGNEAARVPSFGLEGNMASELKGEKIQFIESGQEIRVARVMKHNIFSGGAFPGKIFVVSNDMYERVIGSPQTANYTGYEVADWEDTTDVAIQLETKLFQKWQYEFSSRITTYEAIEKATGIMLFIGLFVGTIFYLCAVSFLYFRLFTDLESDAKYYETLMKLGMNEGEMKQIMTVQMGSLFFVPFIVAAIHTSVAYIALQKVFISGILLSSLLVIGSFLLIHTCCFFILRRSYFLQIKKRIM